MVREVIDLLNIKPGGCYVDATTGEGGHAKAILERLNSAGRLLCIDRDDEALKIAENNLSGFRQRVEFKHSSFAEAGKFIHESGWQFIDGLLMDIGVSSFQLDNPDRGFSFREPGPLDMRFDRKESDTLAHILERVDLDGLANFIYIYGEERHSRKIARNILTAWTQRRIHNTLDLAKTISQAVGGYSGKHPATRTFQALRIMVNQELKILERTMADIGSCIKPGGRVAVISYHSLEDRIVKKSFFESGTFKVITRKPVVPKHEEVKENPRARSAKLRVAEKT